MSALGESSIKQLVPALAMRAAFQHWFGLEKASARVLGCLYEAKGPRPTLALARDAEVSPGSLVDHHVKSLRRALNSEGLDWDASGYRLTEEGRSECKAVLWQIGEELRRAS